MFNPKSDYALNKLDKNAIVCPSATGVHIRLTCEDFASEEEFRRWKTLSDNDYKEIESAGRGCDDLCISLTAAWKATSISAEDAFLLPLLEAEQNKQQNAVLQQLKTMLTERQYHRMCLYYLDGRSEVEIASLEGVNQSSISRSISAGTKIVERFFEKLSRDTA